MHCGGESLLAFLQRLVVRRVLIRGKELGVASHLLSRGTAVLDGSDCVPQYAFSSSSKIKSQESTELFKKSLDELHKQSSRRESTNSMLESESNPSEGTSKHADRFNLDRVDTSFQFRHIEATADGGGTFTVSPRLDAKNTNCKPGGIRVLMIGASFPLYSFFRADFTDCCTKVREFIVNNNKWWTLYEQINVLSFELILQLWISTLVG
ncbi:hypothetical protein FisN_3Hu609 [Fistulifera solaris]|uniref:Uncharacterized protein n=1 Tax=Fistulifera solaris TaxID=1519565 RepID=A0A1Z5K395_FISSO|nr:hypothetical protein FisN_3Hu609 [Fistulifera solaris]|eukprot:GAX20541.1 hypothetical protein FisN_3Hu609 [Fistulifera solaris]